MLVLKKIKETLKTIFYIETIAQVYQEAAKTKMNEIRESVLKTREFIEELLEVYGTIKSVYPFKISFRKKEEVVVFLSSNERFYGKLIFDIWKEVEKYLSEKKSDLVVVGRMGKNLAEKSSFNLKFHYFELNDENPDVKDIRKIFDFIKNYEKILVFHGKFKTVLTQQVVITNISGIEIEKEKSTKEKPYLFEPSPEEILNFFEEELLFSFFYQTLWEHQLSRYATRMIAMHQAQENAQKLKEIIKKEQEKIKRKIYNKKQIEQVFGQKLWI
jgi:F-type H+-transporting ATPase subunit gamma